MGTQVLGCGFHGSSCAKEIFAHLCSFFAAGEGSGFQSPRWQREVKVTPEQCGVCRDIHGAEGRQLDLGEDLSLDGGKDCA